ncbi:uncharacterized protein DEA37_0004622 [Paragonimus westermani]|uniref:Saposin B-type domain-containing protein n=1 Tax=Paragonimus westermani TaxID=34504 RepID=A0A5J4NES2_9TREM|nr:uncharacterized protein DEA37_0004622 [Paragonimus westermani]
MIHMFVFVLLITHLFNVESSVQLKIGVNGHMSSSPGWRKTVGGQEPSDFLECKACSSALSVTMFVFVRDSVKHNIMNRLEFACNRTGVARDAVGFIPFYVVPDCCLTAAREVLGFVFDTLKNMSGRDVCAILDYCPNPPTIDLCPFCLEVVDHVEQIILSEAFLNELHGVVLGLCDSLTIVRSLCYRVMDGLFYNAVDTVKTEFDAKHICQVSSLLDGLFTSARSI